MRKNIDFFLKVCVHATGVIITLIFDVLNFFYAGETSKVTVLSAFILFKPTLKQE